MPANGRARNSRLEIHADIRQLRYAILPRIKCETIQAGDMRPSVALSGAIYIIFDGDEDNWWYGRMNRSYFG